MLTEIKLSDDAENNTAIAPAGSNNVTIALLCLLTIAKG